MPDKQYDDRCSLRFYKNDRMREGKNDPPLSGELVDAQGKKYWLSIWPKTQSEKSKNPGERFWTGSFRPKEDRPATGRPAVDDSDEMP